LPKTLQLEEVPIVRLHDAPKLLVEWSPRWEGFVTSVRPALARSGPRLAGEAPHGVFSYRGMLAALLLESLLLFVAMVVPSQIARLRPYAVPHLSPDEVIYYSGDELPRTEDLGGAQSGRRGHAGGQEAHHRTQTIHVARGSSLAARVVDAPTLKLPTSTGSVANLLALKTNPGPLPVEGSPAQTNIARDQFRRGVTLDSVVRPAPIVSADTSRTAPSLNSAIVPPAPSVRSDHVLVAPSLDSRIIAPAPNVSRQRALAAPQLNANVIPPAPATSSHEISPTRVQMSNVAVVPPPVSAPERDNARTAKLNLPAPAVLAPPPSADSARDLRRLESGSAGRSSPAVVPPPPTQAGNGSFVSSIIGKLFGTQEVVAPPPAVSSASRTAPGGALAANVVPPPPSASGTATGGTSRMARTSPGASIVPPPPSVGGSGSGAREGNRIGSASGVENGLANNVVPPPPSVGSGSGLSGSGRKGNGLGAPGDAGSVLAPPKGAGGNSDNSGVVLSAQPGSDVGKPGIGGKGSLAMSPSGGDKPGFGGSGGGTGIGRGEGTGSGLNEEKPGDTTAENSGAGNTGSGRGSDPNARGGISPTPGPGGAGSAPTGSPAVPGVDVRGGSTVVNLPSFGADGGGSDPNLPGRSSVKGQQGPAITIVATSRSGGAFDFYGKLPGDNYTVYVDTTIGTVVMQFAEANVAVARTHPGTLIGPQGLRTDLPANLPHDRVVIKCRLDASGNVRNPQVLEPGPASMTAKIMAALPGWKFRPAMRGAQPVEVNAILGFNIDTNDRY
jgi:hypothetical protein